MKPLVVIPNYVCAAGDLELVTACVRSIRETAGDACDVLIVDDASPADDLVNGVKHIANLHDAEVHEQPENGGFSRAVNVGMRRALEEGRDVVLCNADIEFNHTRDWLERMQAQPVSDRSALASIVGARLLYPDGRIQHAGVFFSLLGRNFGHIYQFGPGNLPEANQARVCPVTAALQFIRWPTMDRIGLYDETFRMGYEDVDYCVRAWHAGLEVVYAPGAIATHHESVFRGRAEAGSKLERWQAESWLRFVEKWGATNFAEWVPSLSIDEIAA